MGFKRLRKHPKKAINQQVASQAKFKPNDPDAPFTVGQVLHVYPQDTTQEFIPCVPAPGADNTITRVPYKAAITFLGMVELYDGIKLMKFVIQQNTEEVLIGIGCLPHLCNIPSRTPVGFRKPKKEASSFRAKPKRKRKTRRVNKKSPGYIAKVQAKERAKQKKKMEMYRDIEKPQES